MAIESLANTSNEWKTFIVKQRLQESREMGGKLLDISNPEVEFKWYKNHVPDKC